MQKSTRTRSARKSGSQFPLTKHKSRGYWCKNVKQPDGKWKMFYFGKVDDAPDGQKALAKWLAGKDYLIAGRTPPSDPTGLTVRNLVNGFLTAKLRLMRSGELSERTFRQYDQTCGRLVDTMGADRMVEALTPSDFGELRSNPNCRPYGRRQAFR